MELVEDTHRHARSIDPYDANVEIRQLEAFVAVAGELHFGRAAQRLSISQPTLSELIRRLEREVDTLLFTRTTRRVALTGAGSELLPRAQTILDQVGAARAAVQRVANGETGTIRLGVTPPVAPVLAPYLIERFAERAPDVTVSVQQVWLPVLTDMLEAGAVDVAITCGVTPARNGSVHEVFCAEPLLVGLRLGHRLAGEEFVDLRDLADDVLGLTRESLFPAWALSQQQALQAAGIRPPSIDLDDTDIAARRWTDQVGIDWIMLIDSLALRHEPTTVRPVRPERLIPFVLQWTPERARTTAVERFVQVALSVEPPNGWRRC